MAKERKKSKASLEDWLLGILHSIGKPVIISFLLEKDKVIFISVMDKKKFLGLDDSIGVDDDERGKPLSKDKDSFPSVESKKSIRRDYIG